MPSPTGAHGFIADGSEDARRKLNLQHRVTKPHAPQTIGPAERFNGRVQHEVLGITIDTHCKLEILLKVSNQAYNMRRQSAYSKVLLRIRLCEVAWRLSPIWQIRASSSPIQGCFLRPSRSSLTPRRSRIQTLTQTIGTQRLHDGKPVQASRCCLMQRRGTRH
jgi:hypothetical protein